MHCHCHLLQLACVQAANSTPGIKHVYITLTTLCKFFQYSTKRAECLKAVQRVLNMPELKVIKPSDTRWLAHERCVKAVKENYIAIVITLNNIYEETHQPEALGISKALNSKSTVSAVYLLDYVLPQVAKLSKILQSESLIWQSYLPLWRQLCTHWMMLWVLPPTGCLSYRTWRRVWRKLWLLTSPPLTFKLSKIVLEIILFQL